jgi:hypothetical protein
MTSKRKSNKLLPSVAEELNQSQKEENVEFLRKKSENDRKP